MKEGHTPGPWEIIGDTHNGRPVVAAANRDPVALVHNGNDRSEGDAALIAAAPDLLKWLEFLFHHAEEHADPNGYVELVVRKDEWTQILSAVRKAKGGQP